MATSLEFDNLNKLDYRDYFGKMLISPAQMRNRIALARDIEDVILLMFAYWTIALDAEISKAELVNDTISKLTTAVEKHIKLDPYVESHIRQVVNEVVDVTEKRSNERKREELHLRELEDGRFLEDEELNRLNGFDWDAEEESEEDEQFYWTSRERAKIISANEANAFENYNEYREAKASGKTTKVWLTELDERVRFTHTLAEGEKTDIDGLFLVGESKMRFPKDTMYDPAPEEVINCRCTCRYE